MDAAGGDLTARLDAALAFDGLIIDLDGVVWIGRNPIPGAIDALHTFRSRGTPFVFVTNDPSSAAAEHLARLRRAGFDADPHEVVTSGSAMARLIAEREGVGTAVFAIGSQALQREHARAGLTLLGTADGAGAEVVAVGGHPGFDYDELRTATQALRRGASLYAAGRDAVVPMPDGPWPATGALVAAVEVAGGVTATVVGKPEPHLFAIARERLPGCAAIAVVGDTPGSDIAGARRAGLTAILVLSGTPPSRRDVETHRPDAVLPSLAAVAASAEARGTPSVG